MKRALVNPLPKPNQPSLLDEDESHHLVHVFRLKNGDTVECLDGEGNKCLANLELLGKGKARVLLQGDILRDETLLSLPIALECSLLKAEAMEWVIEKSVEIGVRHFYPIQTAHSVIQTSKKGPEFFQERWQKIANQALKQCGRLDKMHVHLPTEMKTALIRNTTHRMWLNETQKDISKNNAATLMQKLSEIKPTLLHQKNDTEITLLIGPEGGWSAIEIDFLNKINTHSVSLGPWVFRAETAAIFAASLSVAIMRN